MSTINVAEVPIHIRKRELILIRWATKMVDSKDIRFTRDVSRAVRLLRKARGW